MNEERLTQIEKNQRDHDKNDEVQFKAIHSELTNIRELLRGQNEFATKFYEEVKPLTDSVKNKKVHVDIYKKDGETIIRIITKVGLVAGSLAAVAALITAIRSYFHI